MTPKQTLWAHIHTVPDFPKPGIEFYDLSPLFVDQIPALIDALKASMPQAALDEVECFVAIEARGFILASLLAQYLGKGVLLVRKKGKLPPPTVSAGYSKEYGDDQLEMSGLISNKKVILVDDVLATGGTLNAVKELAEKCGHHVLGASILLDLPFLHGDLGFPVWTVLEK